MLNIPQIRNSFVIDLQNGNFVVDKTGVKMLEITGESFIINTESAIFGNLNKDYADREIKWYESCSLNVNDIPGETPVIWKQVSDANGYINSNYGWCIWHPENGMQYHAVLTELLKNPFSRRAEMIYTRPTIHMEYNINGMSDFICTECVQYLIRDNQLNAIVKMRSNDVRFGFLNDLHWQKYVLKKLAKDLEVAPGYIIWNAGSLHVYEKDFFLVDNYSKTGWINISKNDYRDKYPESPYI